MKITVLAVVLLPVAAHSAIPAECVGNISKQGLPLTSACTEALQRPQAEAMAAHLAEMKKAQTEAKARDRAKAAADAAEAQEQVQARSAYLDKVRADPKARADYFTCLVCSYRQDRDNALAAIRQAKADAKIAGVVSLRELYDLQTEAAEAGRNLAATERNARAQHIKVGDCHTATTYKWAELDAAFGD